LKILFVHEVSYVKKPIFEMHELPELLALKGHDVTFLDFDEGRKFWDRSSSAATGQISGRVHLRAKINLVRPIQLGIPGLDRLFVVISIIPLLKKLSRVGSFDVVVLYAVPTYGVQTVQMARKSGIPVVFRALDVSHKIRKSVLSPLIKLAEKFVYKRADLLSANNQAMANYCSDLSGRTRGSAVHYPPLDLEHFKIRPKDAELANLLGIKSDDKVITYMGSFFYFSGLRQAIEEFARLARPNHKLLLIGGGEQDKELKKLVVGLSIQEQVIFTGLVSYEDLPRYLGLADVAISTLEPTLVANAALPNKVLQYLAAGLQVVSTRLTGLRKTFAESPAVLWADDAPAVVSSAIYFLEEARTKNPTGNRRITELEKYSRSSAVTEFERTLQELTAGLK
jgi:glycosyltransferase involved in cell wall biosynthesis